MFAEILKDHVESSKVSGQLVFSNEIDYEALLTKKSMLLDKWKSMSVDDQRKYKGLHHYEKENEIPDLKDPVYIPAKNFSILMKEVRGRIDREEPLKLLAIESLDFDDATLELAESLENVTEIREIYKLRKTAVGGTPNAGLTAEEALSLKHCFSQGRELFLSGRSGSLMVKPLNFFYALTAYSYGIIILNNPLRYRKDMIFNSHGMVYTAANIQSQFGGSSARGTFSDLVGAFPTQVVKQDGISFSIDCSKSVMEFYEHRFDVSLGTLLSMIPEISEYYELTTGCQSRCFPLEIVSANGYRNVTWEFHIGNGESRPSIGSVTQAFDDFSVSERHGKTIVTVPAARSSNIKAVIYTDLRGKLWFIENPLFPVILPEVAVHFLIASMYSNIMRYKPDGWGSILVNDVPSNVSLMTRHYFSSLQRKFMLLVLRSISRYLPYAT